MLTRAIPILSLIVALMLSSQIKAQEHYSLQKALQTAQENNLFLKTEQLSIDIAEAEIISAKIRPNFVLNNETLQLMKSSEFEPNTSWHNPQNREAMWQLSKPFQIAGQRKNKIEMADNNRSYAEKELADIQRQLYFEVAQSWLEVWALQKQLDVLTIAKGNMDTLVLNNQLRYKNQVITQTELYRTELLSRQYEIQYKSAVQELSNTKKQLGLLMGVQDNISIDTTDDFMTDFPPTSPEDLLSQALSGRSDILAAKQWVEVSDSNIKLQKSLAYPQPEFGLIYNPQNQVPYFGVSFGIELPFTNRNQGEIKKLHIEKKQAEFQLSAIERQLETEVKTAYESYQLNQQNIRSFETVVEQSQIILDNVKYAYLRGGTTIIDFLEAQRSWLETQQQYYEAVQEFRQSHIQLLFSSGLINQLVQ